MMRISRVIGTLRIIPNRGRGAYFRCPQATIYNGPHPAGVIWRVEPKWRADYQGCNTKPKGGGFGYASPQKPKATPGNQKFQRKPPATKSSKGNPRQPKTPQTPI